VIYFQYWVKNAAAKVKAQAQDVALVDQRVALLGKISIFTDHELHPFEMIGVINPMRPAKIWYTKTRIYDNNKLSADCVSTDSGEITNFVNALTSSGLVEVDNKLTIQTNSLAIPPQFKFTLNLTFNAVPKAQMEMPPEPPPTPAPGEVVPETLMGDANAAPDSGPGVDPNQADNTQAAPEAPAVQSGPNIIVNPAAAPEPAPTAAPVPAPAPAPDAAAQ